MQMPAMRPVMLARHESHGRPDAPLLIDSRQRRVAGPWRRQLRRAEESPACRLFELNYTPSPLSYLAPRGTGA